MSVRLSVYAAIALAAALGGSLRYGISLAWVQVAGDGWPWPSLAVNLLGSFLIAVYWRLCGPEGRFPSGLQTRTAIMTGFCGGLTTFSMFGVETLGLLDQARWAGVIVYVTLTAVGALGAVWLGLRDTRRGHARRDSDA